MKRKYAAWITHVAHHRISLLLGNLADFHQKLNTHIAYASPFAPFLLRTLRLRRMNRRFRRICRGPVRDSTVPWFDRQLQVELQGFGWWIAKLCASLTSGEDTASPFRPVADDAGLTRRCQRSTCVTAALPAPRRGWKINYTFALRALTKSLIFSPSSRTDSPLLKCR